MEAPQPAEPGGRGIMNRKRKRRRKRRKEEKKKKRRKTRMGLMVKSKDP